MSELIDRYVDAVTRSVPPAARADLAAELRGSIDDQIEARLEAGEPADDAARAVLVELGDPASLAAKYAERPLHLIGPRYYFEWMRLTRLLLWCVLPFVALGVAISTIAGGEPGEVIGAVIGITLNAGVHVVFWVTLAFAVAERSKVATPLSRWTPEMLPLAAERRAAFGEVIAGFVFVGVTALLLIWDASIGFVPWSATGGDPLPILHPALLPWSVIVGVALAAAGAVTTLSVYLVGRWTWPAAVVTALLAAATATLLVVLLANGRLINPAFTAFALPVPARTLEVLAVILACGIVLAALWSAWDGVRKARHSAGLTGSVGRHRVPFSPRP
jgi:hypothetical protein